MRIALAVAGLIVPALILLDERVVADLRPVADAGGLAGDPRVA
jgi:hypothetical protein